MYIKFMNIKLFEPLQYFNLTNEFCSEDFVDNGEILLVVSISVYFTGAAKYRTVGTILIEKHRGTLRRIVTLFKARC
jgi:hypothetical protein